MSKNQFQTFYLLILWKKDKDVILKIKIYQPCATSSSVFGLRTATTEPLKLGM
jgi:hypothetical protein